MHVSGNHLFVIDEDDVLYMFVVRVFEQNDLCLQLLVYEDVLVHGDDGTKLVTRNLDVKLSLPKQRLSMSPLCWLHVVQIETDLQTIIA